MINLLPPKEKKFIKNEYLGRRFSVVFLLSFLALVVLILFLTPSFFLSSVKKDSLSSELSAVLSAESHQEVSEIEEEIEKINARVDVLSDESEVNNSEIISKTLNVLPNNVFLTEISFNKTDEGFGNLDLRGSSVNREALVRFSDQLKEVDIFKNVDLPVSSLVSDQDLEFQISLDIEV